MPTAATWPPRAHRVLDRAHPTFSVAPAQYRYLLGRRLPLTPAFPAPRKHAPQPAARAHGALHSPTLHDAASAGPGLDELNNLIRRARRRRLLLNLCNILSMARGLLP